MTASDFFLLIGFYMLPTAVLLISLLALVFRGSWRQEHPYNGLKRISLLLFSFLSIYLAISPSLYFLKLESYSEWLTDLLYLNMIIAPWAAALTILFSLLALCNRKNYRWTGRIAVVFGLLAISAMLCQRYLPVVHWICDENTFSWHSQYDNPRRIDFTRAAGASIHPDIVYDSFPLHQVAYVGHSRSIERLLALGADVNACDLDMWTPLHWVAAAGNVEMIELLLNHGAELEVRSWNGRTPLYYAVAYSHKQAVQYLVMKGANIQVQDRKNRSILHLAAAYGRIVVADYLIEQGLDVNSQSDLGTPLHVAVRGREPAMVAMLLNSGACATATDAVGCTPLHYARSSEIPGLLKHGADINARDSKGATPLHHAAQSPSLAGMYFMLAEGAAISATDCRGRTPLDWAIEYGCNENYGKLTSTARYLLSQGARHSIYSAVVANDTAALQMLLENDPDIDINQPVDGKIPLLIAARQRRRRVSKFLLENGADINIRDASGASVLDMAADGGRVSWVKFFLDRGAKPGVIDVAGRMSKSPVVWGRRVKVPLLLKAGGRHSIYSAVRMNDYRAVEKILEEQPSLSKARYHDGTPLLLGCYWRSALLHRILLHNADANSQNTQGSTALHRAADRGMEDSVRVLLMHGANPDIRDNEGDSVWQVSSRSMRKLLMKYNRSAGE
jgi:serine/threonine-protein phosphatase 6 regulatory ankyrin repeat subunit A